MDRKAWLHGCSSAGTVAVAVAIAVAGAGASMLAGLTHLPRRAQVNEAVPLVEL